MKVNDYLEQLKRAKAAKDVRLPEPAAERVSEPRGLPCQVCGQPSRAILNGACIPCDTAEVAARLKAKHAADKARAIAERDAPSPEAVGSTLGALEAMASIGVKGTVTRASGGLRLVWALGREV